ncbi:MAG: epimerase [Gemmatimonadales bacterium]
MKVVLAGGSGQIGTILARRRQARGDDVVVLSRDPQPAPWRTAGWDARTPGAWAAEIDGADVLINLAGRSVDCRYTPANRAAILESRVDSTRVLGQAIAAAARPPRIWLQSSTATIYAHRFDAPNDEATGLIGGTEPDAPASWRFSIDVARAWEAAADELPLPGTRVVKLRTAMVMSPDPGGIFATLLGLVRRGLGGTSGSGRQFVSWIHDTDFLAAIDWLIGHRAARSAPGPTTAPESGAAAGPSRGDQPTVVNLAAPEPLPNAAFMRALRRAWGAPIGLPATSWMLELGAFALRTETELVLKSRRVVPGVLLRDGFRFQFPAWPDAAADLCRRWRERPAGPTPRTG